MQSSEIFTKIKQYKIHSGNRSKYLNLRSKNTFNHTSTKISQIVEGTSREISISIKPLVKFCVRCSFPFSKQISLQFSTLHTNQLCTLSVVILKMECHIQT